MLILAFGAFGVFGVCLVLVGANQEAIAADLGLDLARSGLLVSTLALGVGIGVAGSGPLADRLPRKPIFGAAALVSALALLTVDAQMGFARALVHVFVVGLAMGVHETVLNAAITDHYREQAARPVLLVHTAVTLFAMLAPPAIGGLAADRGWPATFHATGLAYVMLIAGALRVDFPEAPERAPDHAGLRGVLVPALAPFALLAFAYVGVETSLTIFAVPYASTALGLGAGRGLTAISALWFGLLAGRVLLMLVPRRIDARFLAWAGGLGSVVLAVGVGGRLASIEAVFATTGLVMGFVFPVMIALTAERFPEARGSATGLAAGAGALGGFVVPWLHGAIGDHFGVAAALWTLVPWTLLVGAASWYAWRTR